MSAPRLGKAWRRGRPCLRCGNPVLRREPFWWWATKHDGSLVMHAACGSPRMSETTEPPYRKFWVLLEEAEDYSLGILRELESGDSEATLGNVMDYLKQLTESLVEYIEHLSSRCRHLALFLLDMDRESHLKEATELNEFGALLEHYVLEKEGLDWPQFRPETWQDHREAVAVYCDELRNWLRDNWFSLPEEGELWLVK